MTCMVSINLPKSSIAFQRSLSSIAGRSVAVGRLSGLMSAASSRQGTTNHPNAIPERQAQTLSIAIKTIGLFDTAPIISDFINHI